GVLFAGAFALGILLYSTIKSYAGDLLGYLLGNILGIGFGDLVQVAVLGALVIAIVVSIRKELLFATFDPLGAAASGLPVSMLDDVGRTRLGLARIETRRPPRLALVEKVVAAVELDLDRLEPSVLLGGQPVAVAGMLPELLFLVRQGVDPPEDVAVDHRVLLAGIVRPSADLRRRGPSR